ncbi:ATP synthase F0 subunit C [Singulisphaera sp. Ch08]|uniref:ATP synthase F(0) sector subunit c n=1 Tax=Singulisphaera sp. Ch08 TaxID=3120278 RepID=A0AAU7C7E4_9BACT
MKFVKSAVLAFGLLLLAQGSASAQTAVPEPVRAPSAPFADLRAIGVALVIMGAAYGIGSLTKSAVESMARQPETAGNIQTAMIISAALIEGVTFFALIIILLQTY